jgi:hypothetical protein
VPRLRRCLVFLEAIDALTRAAIACRVFDAKHIPCAKPAGVKNAGKLLPGLSTRTNSM